MTNTLQHNLFPLIYFLLHVNCCTTCISCCCFLFKSHSYIIFIHNLLHFVLLILLGADTTNELTVLQTEQEGFVLEPVEVVQKGKRSRRKRKLIVDEDKILSTDSIKAQLSDTTDIVKHASLAPPTKRRMKLKLISSVEQLFSVPCVDLLASPITEVFVVNLTKTITGLEVESKEDEKMETNVVEEETSQESAESVEKNQKNVSVTFEEPLPDFEEPTLPPEEMMVGHFDPEAEEKVEEKEVDVSSSQVDEEQKLNSETEEQFENRRWTKRTNQLLHTLKREFKQKDTVNFNKLVQKNSRKQAAYKFYSCLLLSKDNTLLMSQKDLFGDIAVRKGDHFAAAC